ncbi:hypothetical protein C0993_000366, partial [Termitomyces sp. T159_Od127]
VMGPGAINDNTSETLQFPKFNGTNYHVWADNMKSALLAKGLWGVVSGREPRPPIPPAEFPDLLSSPSSRDESSGDISFKEGKDLMKAMQSKEYSVWEHMQDKYKCWLTKDDSAIGLI